MSTVSNNNIAHAIYLASKEHNHGDQTSFASRVVQFLARRRLLSKAPDILSRLSKIVDEHEGRVVVRVSSAVPLDQKTNKEIVEALISRYKAKEITLIENLDEKLLGGLKIEVDDEVIDLTIKNKIKKLQEHLTKSA